MSSPSSHLWEETVDNVTLVYDVGKPHDAQELLDLFLAHSPPLSRVSSDANQWKSIDGQNHLRKLVQPKKSAQYRDFH